MGIKKHLKKFKEEWSVFPWEKNGMNNLKSHIACLDVFLVEKIREAQMCKEQIQEIRRTIWLRRIRTILGFFSAKKKTEEDQYIKETFFDKLLSVALAIRIVFSRFLAIF